jgi:hypothetical protein
VVVRLIPNSHETGQEKKNVKSAFAELPLGKKLTTLLQLEALTMTETLDTVFERSLSVAGKLLDRLLVKPKSTSLHERKGHRPPEHRP